MVKMHVARNNFFVKWPVAVIRLGKLVLQQILSRQCVIGCVSIVS